MNTRYLWYATFGLLALMAEPAYAQKKAQPLLLYKQKLVLTGPKSGIIKGACTDVELAPPAPGHVYNHLTGKVIVTRHEAGKSQYLPLPQAIEKGWVTSPRGHSGLPGFNLQIQIKDWKPGVKVEVDVADTTVIATEAELLSTTKKFLKDAKNLDVLIVERVDKVREAAGENAANQLKNRLQNTIWDHKDKVISAEKAAEECERLTGEFLVKAGFLKKTEELLAQYPLQAGLTPFGTPPRSNYGQTIISNAVRRMDAQLGAKKITEKEALAGLAQLQEEAKRLLGVFEEAFASIRRDHGEKAAHEFDRYARRHLFDYSDNKMPAEKAEQKMFDEKAITVRSFKDSQEPVKKEIHDALKKTETEAGTKAAQDLGKEIHEIVWKLHVKGLTTEPARRQIEQAEQTIRREYERYREPAQAVPVFANNGEILLRVGGQDHNLSQVLGTVRDNQPIPQAVRNQFAGRIVLVDVREVNAETKLARLSSALADLERALDCRFNFRITENGLERHTHLPEWDRLKIVNADNPAGIQQLSRTAAELITQYLASVPVLNVPARGRQGRIEMFVGHNGERDMTEAELMDLAQGDRVRGAHVVLYTCNVRDSVRLIRISQHLIDQGGAHSVCFARGSRAAELMPMVYETILQRPELFGNATSPVGAIRRAQTLTRQALELADMESTDAKVQDRLRQQFATMPIDAGQLFQENGQFSRARLRKAINELRREEESWIQTVQTRSVDRSLLV